MRLLRNSKKETIPFRGHTDRLLWNVFVKGRILSADALHTQHVFCASVTRWEGDYVLIARAISPSCVTTCGSFSASRAPIDWPPIYAPLTSLTKGLDAWRSANW